MHSWFEFVVWRFATQGAKITIVSHQSRANFSLNSNILGHNSETGEPENIFRSYAIVKDSVKNVTLLPTTFSIDTFQLLQAEGVLMAGDFNPKEVYQINLTDLPVVNRAFFAKPFTAQDFCAAHVEVNFIKSINKYLKKRKVRSVVAPTRDASRLQRLLCIFVVTNIDVRGVVAQRHSGVVGSRSG